MTTLDDLIQQLIALVAKHHFDHDDVVAFISKHSDNQSFMDCVDYAARGRMDRGVMFSLRIWRPNLEAQAA